MKNIRYFEYENGIYRIFENKTDEVSAQSYIDGIWIPFDNPFEILNSGHLIPNDTIEPLLKNHDLIDLSKAIPIYYYGITACIIVASLILFICYRAFENIQIRSAQQEMKKAVSDIQKSLIFISVESEILTDEIQTEWKEAIFSDYKKRDFNLAILDVMLRNDKRIQNIKIKIDEAGKAVSAALGNTSEGNNQLPRLKDIYLVIAKYGEFAISPSGTLQSYGQQKTTLLLDVKSALRELQLITN
jgi:hypothetical protein